MGEAGEVCWPRARQELVGTVTEATGKGGRQDLDDRSPPYPYPLLCCLSKGHPDLLSPEDLAWVLFPWSHLYLHPPHFLDTLNLPGAGGYGDESVVGSVFQELSVSWQADPVSCDSQIHL